MTRASRKPLVLNTKSLGLDTPDAVRRVLTREAAMTLSDTLARFVGEEWRAFMISHSAITVIKVTNDRILSTHDCDEVRISFGAEVGSGIPVSVSINQWDDATLRRIVQYLKSMAPPHPSIREYEDAPNRDTTRPRPQVPVTLWHDSTAAALSDMRETMVPTMLDAIDDVRRQQGLVSVSTIGVAERATLIRYRGGLTAWVEETDSEATVTARTPDGKGSGWSGAASREWSTIHAEPIVANAVAMVDQGRTPVAYEPGRRTAILSAAAVAQLLRNMEWLFDAESTDSGNRPFSVTTEGPRKNKLGRHVVDSRITMVSDPADPLGGFAPFLEEGGVPGLPVSATTWIEAGVLKNLAYSLPYSTVRGKPWHRRPRSVRLMPTAGTPTHTVSDMIANCEHGIYVNRLSNVAVVDPRTWMMTGVTRDGCFLVRNGKIERAIKNFWFLESPLFILNRLLAIGVPGRAPFGYVPPRGQDDRWPLEPVIAPALMVGDFNFSSMSDSV